MSLFGGKRRDGEEPDAAGAAPAASPEPARPEEAPRPWLTGARGRASGSSVAGEGMANIGKSVSIKGDLSGDEDLVIEGNVEGKIQLPSSQLTIGPNGKVSAEVHAKSVVVVGRLTGNVHASERVEIQGSGVLEGDVHAPRLVIAEGAVLNGAVEMGGAQGAAAPRPAAAGERARSA